jgi:hypothetical protein
MQHLTGFGGLRCRFSGQFQFQFQQKDCTVVLRATEDILIAFASIKKQLMPNDTGRENGPCAEDFEVRAGRCKRSSGACVDSLTDCSTSAGHSKLHA